MSKLPEAPSFRGAAAAANPESITPMLSVLPGVMDSGFRLSPAPERPKKASGLHAVDELRERGELLRENLLGGLVLELQRLLVELGLRRADEDLRRAEDERVE